MSPLEALYTRMVHTSESGEEILAGYAAGRMRGIFSVVGGHLHSRQLQLALQNVKDGAGQLFAPLFDFVIAPVAIQANGVSDVFRKSLPIGAFAHQSVSDLAPGSRVVHMTGRHSVGIREVNENLSNVAELGAIIPGMAGVNLGMRPPSRNLFGCSFFRNLFGWIVIENALAGIAKDQLAAAHFVIDLRPHHHRASSTLLITNFCQSCSAEFRYAIIVPQQVSINRSARAIPFCRPL